MKIGISQDIVKRLNGYYGYHPTHPSKLLICYSLDDCAKDIEEHFRHVHASSVVHAREWLPSDLWPDVELIAPEAHEHHVLLEPESWQEARDGAKAFRSEMQEVAKKARETWGKELRGTLVV